MFRPHLDNIRLSPGEQASRDRLRRHVDVLAGLIGPRHVGRYDSLLAAERYVRDQLAATRLSVADQPYDVYDRRTVRNLVAEQPGHDKSDQIVIVGAHYDSIDCTAGADDNASAVAGLLEIAQRLSARRFRRTVRYVSFVNEEPPFYKTDDMGSLRYARRCRQLGENVVGMINLEMIGYYTDAPGSQEYPPLGPLNRVLPPRGNFVAICGNFPSCRLLARTAWAFRRAVKFPVLPFATPKGVTGSDMSDNWSFWECGYPALMVTDTSFLRNPHYHRPTDTLDTLHLPAMTRVVAGLAAAVAHVAGPMK
jgi:Zn-dependent M28 family amino/carboxypeptidase